MMLAAMHFQISWIAAFQAHPQIIEFTGLS
jgi:hypothetical protein